MKIIVEAIGGGPDVEKRIDLVPNADNSWLTLADGADKSRALSTWEHNLIDNAQFLYRETYGISPQKHVRQITITFVD